MSYGYDTTAIVAVFANSLFVVCFPFLFYVFMTVVELWYDTTATIVAAFADRLISVFSFNLSSFFSLFSLTN